MKKWDEASVAELTSLREAGTSWEEMAKYFEGRTPNSLRKAYNRFNGSKRKQSDSKPGPRILLLDIETAPLLSYTWGLFDQTISLGQVHTDWFILSWSAKFLGEDRVMYADQRNSKNIEDDSKLLKEIWNLLDQSDVVISQNGVKFDIRKLNARFIINGMKPPSSFRNIDTLKIAKKHFGFTSNKLEYMTKKLCTKYKKLDHGKFPGFKLWEQCLKGNLDAFKEMQTYNEYDVLALEELYLKLRPWDKTINFDVYSDSEENVCSCGHTEFKKKGFVYSNTGKFQRLVCTHCGAESRETENLLTTAKRKTLRR